MLRKTVIVHASRQRKWALLYQNRRWTIASRRRFGLRAQSDQTGSAVFISNKS